jgi:hypothetical protein
MKEEKLMMQKLQEKFSYFTKRFSNSLNKTEQRFLKESCYGIISSQSCIVRRTAQSLGEKIASKKTQERLIYHLDKADLSIRLSQELLQKQSHRLKQDSLIIVDPSDIVKQYAETMEGLSKVRDGNDGKWKSGYDALDIVGVNRDGNDISILPMHSQLHSKAIDIDTMKNMLFDRIVDIIVHSNNKGIFVFDRQYDDRKVIKELHSHEASYIIRMKNNRDVYSYGKKQNIDELARSTKLRYRFKVSDEATISSGMCPVEIRLNPHQVKKPTLSKALLLVAKIKSNKKDSSIRSGMFYFLCKINRDDLPKREMVKFILDAYKLRWKIEEVHRQVKVDYGWEKIQLQTYRRLQNMNTILWVAISFLYSLDRWKYQLSKVFSHIMMERNKLSELASFIYYRLAEVLKYCFNRISLYSRITYQKQKNELLQLRLTCF